MFKFKALRAFFALALCVGLSLDAVAQQSDWKDWDWKEWRGWDALAKEPEPIVDRLVIQNALLHVEGVEGGTEVVNLLIEKGTLSVITKDTISQKESDLAIDAKKGVIMGDLQEGSPATFMILVEDPRKNFDVLLDTQTFASFVIKDGLIKRNRLRPSSSEIEEEKGIVEESGWFAYNAPPMSLSTYYQNQDKWNRFESKWINATFLAAVVFDRMAWLDQDAESEGQVGDLSIYDGGEIRGLRFGSVGSFNFDKPWIFTIFAATAAFDKGFDSSDDDSVNVFDLRLDIPFYQDTTISIGKQKEPISMERLTSMVHLPMQERSAVSDAMMASRNTGIVLSGTGLNRRSTWAGGVFNSWLDASAEIGETATQLVGRGTLIPLQSANQNALLHVGGGLRYSNAKNGIRYATEPEFNQSTNFVDTGFVPVESTMLYNLEAACRWGPVLFSGEFVLNQIDDDAAGNPAFSGYHGTLSYALTGEVRPYNNRSGLFAPLPVSRPVNRGGIGAWELSARYSKLDLNEGNVTGGDMDIYSLGLNWWLSTAASVGINYRHIVLDDGNMTGHSDGIMTRILLVLE